MTTINRNATVPYTTAQMYDLVNDVEKYPEFVPYCKASEIIKQTQEELRATLHLSKAGFEKSFTTSNRLLRNKMIEISLLDGPFKTLHGYWRFTDLGDKGSKIELDLQFEFKNRLFTTLFGPVFTQMANMLVESFCERAIALYGAKVNTQS